VRHHGPVPDHRLGATRRRGRAPVRRPVTSRLSPWRQFKAAAIATIGVPVVEALGATYTWRETGREHLRTRPCRWPPADSRPVARPNSGRNAVLPRSWRGGDDERELRRRVGGAADAALRLPRRPRLDIERRRARARAAETGDG
jgi:hypothetical protein